MYKNFECVEDYQTTAPIGILLPFSLRPQFEMSRWIPIFPAGSKFTISNNAEKGSDCFPSILPKLRLFVFVSIMCPHQT